MRYKVEYISGCGQSYDEGIYEVRTMPKTIRVEMIEEAFFSNHQKGFKARIGKGTGNPIGNREDGEFTVYFEQAGIPYIFTKLTEQNETQNL